MKKIIIIILSVFLIAGCSSKENSELQKIIDENNYIIVDVRTKEEFDEGHLKDALNIPYEEIGENIFEQGKIILVYCKSGKRSKIAYDTLKQNGYNAYDLGAYDKITEFEKVK